MTKSRKSKILALALCAGVMSGIYASPALAGWGNEHVSYDEGTVSSDIGDLKNPSLHHPNGPHNDDAGCGEEVDGTDVTIGDLNKVIDDLVANDTKVANEVSGEIDKINKKIENIDIKDTDMHVKDGAATVADNGDVTMDIVDKNGEDTHKDVTISGLASDKELAAQKSELEKADEDLREQINDNKTAIDDLDGKVTDIQEQINNIDVEDTNTQVNEGTYTAEADGTVNLDVVDKITDEIKEDAITIEGLASDSELADETTARVEADAEHDRLLADHKEQIENNAQAIADETAAREEADAEHDRLLADHKEQIENNAQAIADETAAREEADAEHDRLLADHKEQIENNAQAIADETAAREEADEVLQADINAKEEQSKYRDQQLQGQINDQGQQIGDNTAAIKNHTSVIGVEDSSQLAKEYADTNYISGATDMVEADQRLDAAISDVSTRVDGIENRVDGLEDRIDKVGAMSAAIANLRTMGYDPAAPTEVAVGVGQYRDETGMALGLFHYPNRDFMLSLSVSTSGDEYMGGIGATWKFGRKSPEKVAEIKKAQEEADLRRAEEAKIAKAEEMKKAAKEAKVQAQMERHAKMAAERAALEEA